MKVGLLILLCALVLADDAPAYADAHGGPDGIKRSAYLAVDGAQLYLQIRGANRSAPVLLWLHGGPGGAERPLFRYYNGALERNFVVAYWDQRGAGRSFDPKADPARLTIARHVADLAAVVDYLRRELDRRKIVLVGHSWGAALGLLYARDHPDEVPAVIAVNPLVTTRDARRTEYEFVKAEAVRRGDDETLARLRQVGTPPYKSADQVLAMEKLVQRYGGLFYKEPSRAWALVQGLFRGLVRPWDIPRFIKANNVSLDAMHEELLGVDLSHSMRSIGVPVLFFLGRHDRHADAQLAAGYLTSLSAPHKRLIWFERSAHNVPFEEPDLFNATVQRELQLLSAANDVLISFDIK